MMAVGLICVIVIAAADLYMKYYVEKHVKQDEERSTCGRRWILRKVHNHGLMMNQLEKYPRVIRAASLAAMGILLIWQGILNRKPGHILEKIGTALMTGGAVSNTYDRIKRGYVVDYFSFKTRFKKLEKITFNLGDFAIFAGALAVFTGTAFSALAEFVMGKE